jgi:hypothetical protein
VLPARQRWRQEDARTVLDRLESSGLSVRELAERENMNALRLYPWRARLTDRPKTPGFVEIRSAPTAGIEIVFRSGHVVWVPDGFDDDTLQRLVAVLDGQGSRC